MWNQIRLLLQEQSELGLHCLTKRLLKLFSRLQKQTTFVVMGALNMGLDARKPVFGVCEQQRRRPAQSDQRLNYSLIGKWHI